MTAKPDPNLPDLGPGPFGDASDELTPEEEREVEARLEREHFGDIVGPEDDYDEPRYF